MIYLVSFVISTLLLFYSQRLKGNTKTILEIIAIIPLVIIAGFRDVQIGTDTSGYPIDVFQTCKSSTRLSSAISWASYLEAGYVALAYFAAKMGGTFNFFLTLTHAVMLGVLLIAFKRLRVNLALAFMFFYLINFNTSLNAARQSLAISFCIWCFAEYVNRKYIFALLAFACALSFHSTSIFFVSVLGLYFLCTSKYSIMKKKKTSFLIICVFVVAITLLSEILEYAIDLGVAKAEYMDRYGNSNIYGTNIPLSLFALTLFNYIVFLYISNKYRLKSNLLFTRYVLLIAFLLCFTGLISTFAVRLVSYYLVVGNICIVFYLQKTEYKHMWAFFGFYLFYWFMIIVIANLGDTYPYSSKIIEQMIA